MRTYKASYEIPPAPYRPGQKIKIGGKTYRVIASTHTHTQLEGVAYSVANWIIAQMKKSGGELE